MEALKIQPMLARDKTSYAAMYLALAVVSATFFLISPDPIDEYPGSIPWRPGSLLRAIMSLMSLGGWTPTARGIEVKDLALHVGVTLALALAAVCAMRHPLHDAWRSARLPLSAAGLLGLWVGISAASATWSGDPSLSLRQAGLYFMLVAGAAAFGATLRPDAVRAVLNGIVVAGAGAALLCIWYYHERNPFHRPGFPIGNPGTLAASLLPAFVIAFGRCVESVARRATLDARGRLAGGLAASALIPLTWCLALTGARAACVGLAAGLATLVLTHVARRARYALTVIAGLLVTAAASAAYFTPVVDLMERSETIRFRGYMWRYAAELWSRRPISGVGAASFAKLTGALSLTDRQLDPAAFLGDWAGHAHNELFEVFAEIGLFGGVTFVGGLLATALALVRRARDRDADRWWRIAILASLAALSTEMLFNVSLRLPGVPAIFSVLLGAAWATCTNRTTDAAAPGPPNPGRLQRLAMLGAAGAAAVLAGGIAFMNWTGVLAERAAYAAMAQHSFEASQDLASQARRLLFDPLRVLYAEELAVRARLEQARASFAHAREKSASATDRAQAVERSRDAFDAAVAMHARAPTLSNMPATAARAAEMVVDLTRDTDPGTASLWLSRAVEAWNAQRNETPFDPETLLALLRYPGPIGRYVGLLRDALRAGFPDAEWTVALRQVASREDAQDCIDLLLIEAGPIDPATEVDSILASRAPETFRLAAAVHAARGDSATAERFADRAATLYWSARRRLAELYSVARAEQAEYVFRGDVTQARRAADLVQVALGALPRIQAQHFVSMAAPYRRRLATYLLAAGDEHAAEIVAEAFAITASPPPPFEPDAPRSELDRAIADLYVALAESFAHTPDEKRPPLDDWISAALKRVGNHTRAWWLRAWLAAQREGAAAAERALGDAARAGVAQRDLSAIRAALERDFKAPLPEPETQP